jgi:hypothetical protein
LAAPVPGRGAQAAHPASAGSVQRESFAGCAGIGDRPHQFLPLLERAWLRSERDRSGKGGRRLGRVSRRRFEHWHAVKYHQRLCRNWPCALLTSHCTKAKFLPPFRAKRGISLRFRRGPQPTGKQRTWRATVSNSVRIYSQNRASGAVRKGRRQRQAFAR